jgi:hypothetical protein
MSRKHLGGQPSSPDDGIVEAEFVEIHDWKSPPPPPTPPRPPPKAKPQQSGCLTFAIGVGSTLALVLIVANWASQPGNHLFNNAAAGSPTAAQTQLLPVVELLRQNDPRACEHPEAAMFIRSQILPKENSEYSGFTDEEFERVRDLARTDLTEVTASNIRKDVHEIACEANLRYGNGDTGAAPIKFKIRPSASPTGPAIYFFEISLEQRFFLSAAVLSAPEQIVKSDRPAPEIERVAPKDPVAVSEDELPTNEVSDEAAFAPH